MAPSNEAHEVDASLVTKLSRSRKALADVPKDIFLFTNLVDLDLSHNNLQSIPPEIGQLKSLRYVNFMGNKLSELPEEIGDLKSLSRLGLKSNELTKLPASIGRLTALVELFITGNKLKTFPPEIGNCTALVKLQASFNELENLPEEMGSLPQLELFRIAVNKIHRLPPSFAGLNKLAWFSLAGNPACRPPTPPDNPAPSAHIKDLEFGAALGDGASGEVFATTWRPSKRLKGPPSSSNEARTDVVFKRFKADVSPDGHARDEVAISTTLRHPNLIQVVAVVDEPLGLVLVRVEGKPMADKPNLESLLRCRWTPGLTFKVAYVLRVAECLAGALEYLHAHRIAHGDVYAHNVVADEDGNATLVDYGASFGYDESDRVPYEAHEVRALGLLLNDLAVRVVADEDSVAELAVVERLKALVRACVDALASERLAFAAVKAEVESLQAMVEEAKGSRET